MARMLSISKSNAKDAIQRLIRMGLLKEHADGALRKFQPITQIVRNLKMVCDQVELIRRHLESRVRINVLHGSFEITLLKAALSWGLNGGKIERSDASQLISRIWPMETGNITVVSRFGSCLSRSECSERAYRIFLRAGMDRIMVRARPGSRNAS